MACNVGEIIGPLFTGAVAGVLGLQDTGVIVAFSCFGYAIVYFIGSGLLGKWIGKDREDSIRVKMIVPEENSISIKMIKSEERSEKD